MTELESKAVIPWPPAGVDWYYSDDAVCIAHADCRDILPSLGEHHDVIITDPPYGIGSTSHRPSSRWYGYNIEGNDDTALRDFILQWNKGPMLMFDSVVAETPEGTRCTLIWDKGGSVGFNGDNTLPWKSTYELVRVIGKPFTGGRIYESVLHYSAGGFSRPLHPHEKPIGLMLHLVSCTEGVILDPFAGSGSTGRAAKDLRRKAILVEIEERYAEIAAQRMSQLVLL